MGLERCGMKAGGDQHLSVPLFSRFTPDAT
jgi:hypothetical protein